MKPRTLGELAAEGWVTEEWEIWQQYALALLAEKPLLRLGQIMDGWHWFAHDGTYAWDSAGRHKLPYTGLGSPYDECGTILRCDLEPRLGRDYFTEDADPGYAPMAAAHIRRNKILAHQGA